MKRAFIRGIWGVTEDFWKSKDKTYDFEKFDYDKDNGCAQRRYRLNKVINNTLHPKYKDINDQTTIYVMGNENEQFIQSLGIKCRKIHNEPYKYDPVQKSWKHKLDIMIAAMEDYDEIVWLDYDCQLKEHSEYPKDFWSKLGKKASFQASLVRFKHIQSNIRKDPELNKIQPNGAFVYIRNKSIPEKLIKIYDQLGTWSDEIAYAKYTDDLLGGLTMNEYWNTFEPLLSTNGKSQYRFNKERWDIKIANSCFHHKF